MGDVPAMHRLETKDLCPVSIHLGAHEQEFPRLHRIICPSADPVATLSPSSDNKIEDIWWSGGVCAHVTKGITVFPLILIILAHKNNEKKRNHK